MGREVDVGLTVGSVVGSGVGGGEEHAAAMRRVRASRRRVVDCRRLCLVMGWVGHSDSELTTEALFCQAS